MYRIMGLTKVSETEPQQYMLLYQDLENKHAGYTQSTAHGTAEEIRDALKDGMTSQELDRLFEHAIEVK